MRGLARALLPAGALALGLGLIAGTGHDPLTESDVITAYADRYVAAVPDAAPTDCRAWPGSGPVWLVVACGTGASARTWEIGPDGRALTARHGQGDGA